MKPSVYDEVTTKDTVVEDHNQVKVVFAGGNVFHIFVEGMDEHETKRGATKAWERAEAIRLDLNPAYVPPAPPAGEPPVSEEAKASDAAAKPTAKAKAENKPKAPAAPAAVAGAAPKGPQKYMIGDVIGTTNMVPVPVVLDLLADQAGRVALLQGSDAARRLQRKVRATDGRCAPIFLTKQDIDDKDEKPALFSGLDTLAAAMNVDMPKICVVILPSDKARSVQGMIAAMSTASMASDGDDSEEMIRRAYSDDG